MNKPSLSRRSFLKTGAALASGLTVAPALLIGNRRSALNRLNLAVIGCGNRAEQLVREIPDDVNIVAMVNPVKEKRDRFAREYNVSRDDTHCKAYNDFRVIIGSDEIDGIILATPDHWHVPVAMEAARHGKDMYVEKPLGVSLLDAFRLRRMFEKKDILFQYGTQQRSSLFARTAIDIVRNGYIGALQEVDVWSPSLGSAHMDPFTAKEQPVPEGLDYDLYVGPSELLPFHPERVTMHASWHSYNYAIGFIAGWGSHPLDICQWGLDMDDSGPVHYEGTGVLPHPESLYNTTRAWDIHCRYPNGIPMRFMDSETALPIVTEYTRFWRGDGTVFKGSEGWVQYSRGAIYLFKDGKYMSTANFPFKETDRRAYVSDNQVQNFIDCMRSREPTINPLESAIRSDTISHLAEIVVRTGEGVTWNLDAERIENGSPEQLALLDRPKREPYGF